MNLGSPPPLEKQSLSELLKPANIGDHSPVFRKNVFTCPRCSAVTQHHWTDIYRRGHQAQRVVNDKLTDVAISTCTGCAGRALWFEEKLIFPSPGTSEPVPNDLPTDLARDFEEASRIANISPRAAAALLRMIVEALCKSAASKSKFEDAMQELERRGLPEQIATAMDVVRWNGNEALHGGKLYGTDDQQTVAILFRLVRMIVAWSITEQKQLQQLLAAIPEEKRKAAEERRAKARQT